MRKLATTDSPRLSTATGAQQLKAEKKNFCLNNRIAKPSLQALAIVGAAAAGAGIAAAISFAAVPMVIGALVGLAAGVTAVGLYHLHGKSSAGNKTVFSSDEPPATPRPSASVTSPVPTARAPTSQFPSASEPKPESKVTARGGGKPDESAKRDDPPSIPRPIPSVAPSVPSARVPTNQLPPAPELESKVAASDGAKPDESAKLAETRKAAMERIPEEYRAKDQGDAEKKLSDSNTLVGHCVVWLDGSGNRQYMMMQKLADGLSAPEKIEPQESPRSFKDYLDKKALKVAVEAEFPEDHLCADRAEAETMLSTFSVGEVAMWRCTSPDPDRFGYVRKTAEGEPNDLGTVISPYDFRATIGRNDPFLSQVPEENLAVTAEEALDRLLDPRNPLGSWIVWLSKTHPKSVEFQQKIATTPGAQRLLAEPRVIPFTDDPEGFGAKLKRVRQEVSLERVPEKYRAEDQEDAKKKLLDPSTPIGHCAVWYTGPQNTFLLLWPSFTYLLQQKIATDRFSHPDVMDPLESPEKLKEDLESRALFDSDRLVHTPPEDVLNPKTELLSCFKDVTCPRDTAVESTIEKKFYHANRMTMSDVSSYIAATTPMRETQKEFLLAALANGGLVVNLLQMLGGGAVEYFPQEEDGVRVYDSSGKKEPSMYDPAAGDVKVTNVGIENLGVPDEDGGRGSGLVLYQLCVEFQNSGGGVESKTLKILHYSQWADFGVPEESATSPIENLFEQVDRHDNGKPIIVHCRGGIGRTGTFITLRTLRRLIDSGKIQSDQEIEDSTVENINIGRKARDKNYVQSHKQLGFAINSAKKYLARKSETGSKGDR